MRAALWAARCSNIVPICADRSLGFPQPVYAARWARLSVARLRPSRMHISSRLHPALVLAWTLAGAGLAQAQVAPASEPNAPGPFAANSATGGALTLERAVALAQARNEQALSAGERARAASARDTRARSFFFPELSLSGTYTRRLR